MRIIPRGMTLVVLGAFLAGCAATIGRYPQTTDEFISTFNGGGGLFKSVERMTVDRPSGAVVASLKEYAKECLDIKVNKKRASRYATSKYERPSTEPVTYNTKVVQIKNGATALSVQEWGAMPNEKGPPPGGMYTMVAEIRAVGKKTEVNIYHLGKPFLANPLKGWIAGDKRDCPAL